MSNQPEIKKRKLAIVQSFNVEGGINFYNIQQLDNNLFEATWKTFIGLEHYLHNIIVISQFITNL